MRVLYGSTIVWGLLGTLLAWAIIGNKSALDTWWVLSGILAGGMVGVFLLGMIARRAGNHSGVTAVVLGVVVILWMTLPSIFSQFEFDVDSLGALESPFHKFMIPVFGTATIVLVGWLLGLLLNDRRGREST